MRDRFEVARTRVAAAPDTSEGVDADVGKGVSIVEEEDEDADEASPSEVISEEIPVSWDMTCRFPRQRTRRR